MPDSRAASQLPRAPRSLRCAAQQSEDTEGLTYAGLEDNIPAPNSSTGHLLRIKLPLLHRNSRCARARPLITTSSTRQGVYRTLNTCSRLRAGEGTSPLSVCGLPAGLVDGKLAVLVSVCKSIVSYNHRMFVCFLSSSVPARRHLGCGLHHPLRGQDIQQQAPTTILLPAPCKGIEGQGAHWPDI